MKGHMLTPLERRRLVEAPFVTVRIPAKSHAGVLIDRDEHTRRQMHDTGFTSTLDMDDFVNKYYE